MVPPSSLVRCWYVSSTSMICHLRATSLTLIVKQQKAWSTKCILPNVCLVQGSRAREGSYRRFRSRGSLGYASVSSGCVCELRVDRADLRVPCQVANLIWRSRSPFALLLRPSCTRTTPSGSVPTVTSRSSITSGTRSFAGSSRTLVSTLRRSLDLVWQPR